MKYFVAISLTSLMLIVMYFSLKVSSAYMRSEANSTMMRD